MRALGGLSFVVGAAAQRIADSDLFEHESLLFEVDLPLCLGGQPPPARVDPARLQRAPQSPGESTGGRGDDVVERGRVVGVLAGRRPVMLADLVMRAEHDRL